jgi:RNA 2',3'-cyclic 3'-phosphodiesterase
LIRSFLAIELPKVIQDKIGKIQGDLRASSADVRWVAPEKIHITLKFLGDIEESKIDPIADSFREFVYKTPPFFLSVQGTGAFPDVKNPRVVWMGLADEKGVLVFLQRQIETALEKIGFPAESRSFRPHLTLGRVNSNRGKATLAERIERHGADVIGDFEVEAVLLVKSDLRPSGPLYTPLRAIKLGMSSDIQGK